MFAVFARKIRCSLTAKKQEREIGESQKKKLRPLAVVADVPRARF
jgi:hypothetical protein